MLQSNCHGLKSAIKRTGKSVLVAGSCSNEESLPTKTLLLPLEVRTLQCAQGRDREFTAWVWEQLLWGCLSAAAKLVADTGQKATRESTEPKIQPPADVA